MDQCDLCSRLRNTHMYRIWWFFMTIWLYQHIVGLQETQVHVPGTWTCHHTRLQVPTKLLFPTEIFEINLHFMTEKNQLSKAFLTNANPSILFTYSLGHCSPCQGTGEGALARLLPAPGTNLQTHARTRLDGPFSCLHHNLSPLPHPLTHPQLFGFLIHGCAAGWSPQATCRQTSLLMRVWNQVGPGWRGEVMGIFLHHHFPPFTFRLYF